jgi:hypothetical protein
MTATRRLAAILAADVAGYSRLIGADEGGTEQALQFKEIQAELFDPTMAGSSRPSDMVSFASNPSSRANLGILFCTQAVAGSIREVVWC